MHADEDRQIISLKYISRTNSIGIVACKGQSSLAMTIGKMIIAENAEKR